VLVNVARHHQSVVHHQYPNGACCAAAAVASALCILGYSDAPDPYGLAARAVAILEGDAR
jgi:hypothetical protein